jgi:hypothetical protein
LRDDDDFLDESDAMDVRDAMLLKLNSPGVFSSSPDFLLVLNF